MTNKITDVEQPSLHYALKGEVIDYVATDGIFLLIRTNRKLLPKESAVAFNALYVSTLIFGISYSFPFLFYIILAINLSAIYRPYKALRYKKFLFSQIKNEKDRNSYTHI